MNIIGDVIGVDNLDKVIDQTNQLNIDIAR
jgi:hypothetical protein